MNLSKHMFINAETFICLTDHALLTSAPPAVTFVTNVSKKSRAGPRLMPGPWLLSSWGLSRCCVQMCSPDDIMLHLPLSASCCGHPAAWVSAVSFPSCLWYVCLSSEWMEGKGEPALDGPIRARRCRAGEGRGGSQLSLQNRTSPGRASGRSPKLKYFRCFSNPGSLPLWGQKTEKNTKCCVKTRYIRRELTLWEV